MDPELSNIKTEHVWIQFKNELERFIKSKVTDRMAAEDILQDVFVKIHLNLATLRSDERLSAWLYKVANNTIMDYYRKRRFFDDSSSIEIMVEDSEKEREQFQRCIFPFIEKLPEKYKKALIHADFELLNQKQLAQKMGISYSGAKTRVQRARRLLHSFLIACCDIETDRYGNIVSHQPRGKCLCAA